VCGAGRLEVQHALHRAEGPLGLLRDLFEMHTGKLGYTDDEMIQLLTVDREDYFSTYLRDRPKLRLVAS
jgi:hypothetical protein